MTLTPVVGQRSSALLEAGTPSYIGNVAPLLVLVVIRPFCAYTATAWEQLMAFETDCA